MRLLRFSHLGGINVSILFYLLFTTIIVASVSEGFNKSPIIRSILWIIAIIDCVIILVLVSTMVH